MSKVDISCCADHDLQLTSLTVGTPRGFFLQKKTNFRKSPIYL